MLEVWLPLLSIAAIAAWWYHVLQLRERAVAHAREMCERRGLQLLDDSVALHRLRVSWKRGALRVTREYRLEISLGGNDRRTASITLLGARIVGTSLPEREAPDAPAPVAPHTAASSAVPASDTGNVVPITRARRTLH